MLREDGAQWNVGERKKEEKAVQIVIECGEKNREKQRKTSNNIWAGLPQRLAVGYPTSRISEFQCQCIGQRLWLYITTVKTYTDPGVIN
jgi:hypothetical protein